MLLINSKKPVVYKVKLENIPLLIPVLRSNHDYLFDLYIPSSFSFNVYVVCVLQNEIILHALLYNFLFPTQ